MICEKENTMSDLLYEKQGGIAWITINRPDKRNALNTAVINGIDESLKKAADDPQVRVVILCGAGEKAFTAGFDLKESMENDITGIVERRADTAHEIEFFMRMWRFPKPIIAAIQGYCIGGGVTLAMLSDIIIASEDATFGNPEILLGYTPEIPMEVWKMPFNKVREFFYLSKYFTAKEMADMSVVNAVVPFEKLRDEALKTAERIALVPPESMKMIKYSLNKCYELQGFHSTIDFVSEMFNLGRTYMQTSQVDEFKTDIQNSGLKQALSKKYDK